MESSNSLKVEIFENINDIPKDSWNACVGADEPFARHEFLCALEDSGCTSAKSGWMPQHFVLFDADEIKACAPAYLKGHSYGEYVFDWSWAEAYERAGGKYYPKLQCAIPFTPVQGHRFLMHPNALPHHRDMLIKAMINRAQTLQLSSFHVTFSTQEEWNTLAEHGLSQRTGHQYHWDNRDYRSFDDFLSELSSRKRKSIRKERKALKESPVVLKTLSGNEIKSEHWESFYQFYIDTSGRKWGHPYINQDFFFLLGERLPDAVVLILAYNDDKIVAGALNLKGCDTLYGRYWGCLEDYRFLHFEACYYQAIDYAIQHRLKRVEAGAQGQHKIQRGYLPVETYSAHWIANPSFKTAVDDFLDHDKRVNDLEMKELFKFNPYKQDQ